MPKVQRDSAKQGEDAILMILDVRETEIMNEEQVQVQSQWKRCVECGISIDVDTLSFEQKLIEDEDFCRRCWDGVMDDTEDAQLPSLIPARK